MKVKVCGLRDIDNINALKQLPIELMGFIFYPSSKRYIGAGAALKTTLKDENWNSTTRKVGVFVDVEIDEILHHVHDYNLDFVQLHGNESPEYCAELNHIWSISSMRQAKLIKAFAIQTAEDFEQVEHYQSQCQLFIFDTKGENPGGNGVSFDWNLLENYKGIIPFLLSGGISIEDAEKIRQLKAPQLAGVDINSRFEIEPAMKDVEKVKQFIEKLK